MEITIRQLVREEGLPMDLLLLADPSLEMIEDYTTRGTCYGAYMDKEIVGVGVLLPTRPLTLELVNLAVDEKHHGQGIGTAIIRHLIEEARKTNARTLEIGTGNPGMIQLTLYQKCGFRMVGVEVDHFVRHYPESIVEHGIPCRDMVRLSMNLK